MTEEQFIKARRLRGEWSNLEVELDLLLGEANGYYHKELFESLQEQKKQYLENRIAALKAQFEAL